VVATSAVVKPGSSGAPPIGLPIAGATAYLLDEEGQQVPDGNIGEIYIGGGGVGRGYRNLPDVTERNFRPDPFASDPSARMYRTGDRGVRRPDGQIEFRGRLDRQTKIRGQRVELDEIGSVLAGHPNVAFAAALANSIAGGENQLVGYVLPKNQASVPTAHELKEYLLRSLPDYMVPAVFVRLNALPLSPNGKLDLAMLPPPADARLLEGRTEKPPASAIEGKLLTMVRELLANDAVGAEDSFFLAGGHSLLGMQLLMRLRDTFGVELTLRQLFEAPTVERLALLVERVLDENRLAKIWARVLGSESVGLDDNFFDMGGDSVSIAALGRATTAEFGQSIPIAELYESPTVRQQAELLQKRAKHSPALPPGVLALQPHGNRSGIFWVHYLSVDLAKVIGNDQPFLYVAVTGDDFPSLGENPTLQTIAACLLRKILAAQAKGPYTIGGFCLGGILAYEIAYQLRAAGNEVSLLVLLDPPNPAYLESCDSLTRQLRYVRYAVSRGARLGLRVSLVYFREHVFKWFGRTFSKVKFSKTEVSRAQDMIEAAALRYQPEKYDSKVLLLLASERPPHVNFLPGWQAVVPQGLYTQYLDGHHRDLLKGENLRSVAHAIVSHIPPGSDGPPSILVTAAG
jgi:thioesterase domain-containing protein/aryl carrier-like protein